METVLYVLLAALLITMSYLMYKVWGLMNSVRTIARQLEVIVSDLENKK